MILAGRRLNDSMANYVAGQVVKLMSGKKILVKGSRILVLGLTFKENCPDLRNSKVADVVRELKNYGAKVDVYDPWIDRDEAEHEYGIRPIKRMRDGAYDAAVLAVGHKEFRDQGIASVRKACKKNARRLRHQVRVPAPTRSTVGSKRQRVKILLTGAAGFIGSTRAQKLLARGDEVVGLDNLNDYYDPNLKRARLAILEREPKFRFVKMDLADKGGMKSLFAREKFPRVIHLAAQAGVRYSLENPQAYIDSNVTGTLNVLEGCRHNDAEHLVFASTSSVYGLNTNMPFSRAPRRRPSAVAVRVDQARQRAHGAQLRRAVQTTGDRPALLHRVRSLGPARHGAVPVHEEHPRGQAHRRVQPRPPQARLHLRRRHRRGRGARLRPRRARLTTSGAATTRIRRPAARRSASTTSATTRRSS